MNKNEPIVSSEVVPYIETFYELTREIEARPPEDEQKSHLEALQANLSSFAAKIKNQQGVVDLIDMELENIRKLSRQNGKTSIFGGTRGIDHRNLAYFEKLIKDQTEQKQKLDKLKHELAEVETSHNHVQADLAHLEKLNESLRDLLNGVFKSFSWVPDEEIAFERQVKEADTKIRKLKLQIRALDLVLEKFEEGVQHVAVAMDLLPSSKVLDSHIQNGSLLSAIKSIVPAFELQLALARSCIDVTINTMPLLAKRFGAEKANVSKEMLSDLGHIQNVNHVLRLNNHKTWMGLAVECLIHDAVDVEVITAVLSELKTQHGNLVHPCMSLWKFRQSKQNLIIQYRADLADLLNQQQQYRIAYFEKLALELMTQDVYSDVSSNLPVLSATKTEDFERSNVLRSERIVFPLTPDSLESGSNQMNQTLDRFISDAHSSSATNMPNSSEINLNRLSGISLESDQFGFTDGNVDFGTEEEDIRSDDGRVSSRASCLTEDTSVTVTYKLLAQQKGDENLFKPNPSSSTVVQESTPIEETSDSPSELVLDGEGSDSTVPVLKAWSLYKNLGKRASIAPRATQTSPEPVNLYKIRSSANLEPFGRANTLHPPNNLENLARMSSSSPTTITGTEDISDFDELEEWENLGYKNALKNRPKFDNYSDSVAGIFNEHFKMEAIQRIKRKNNVSPVSAGSPSGSRSPRSFEFDWSYFADTEFFDASVVDIEPAKRNVSTSSRLEKPVDVWELRAKVSANVLKNVDKNKSI
ncbi:hypothetical protein HK098_001482 [Nowakowskiella sp. JEL0407]|nr:hypothetical protein HK098_001482 [Nowakowskiella sp. JEL0407]